MLDIEQLKDNIAECEDEIKFLEKEIDWYEKGIEYIAAHSSGPWSGTDWGDAVGIFSDAFADMGTGFKVNDCGGARGDYLRVVYDFFPEAYKSAQLAHFMQDVYDEIEHQRRELKEYQSILANLEDNNVG